MHCNDAVGLGLVVVLVLARDAEPAVGVPHSQIREANGHAGD